METFELQVEQKTYKVIRAKSGSVAFNVFNYSSFHTIAKTRSDRWEVVEHRFGNHIIPLQKLGQGIDDFLGL